jgi:hypothetical protein
MCNGYSQEIIEFCRAFLTSGLKDNPHLERGVITGILRVGPREHLLGPEQPRRVHAAALQVCHRVRLHRGRGARFTGPGRQERRPGRGAALVQRLSLCRPCHLQPVVGAEFRGRCRGLGAALLAEHQRQRAHQAPARASRHPGARRARGAHGRRQRAAHSTRTWCSTSSKHDEDALWSLLVFSGYLNAEEQPRLPGAGRSNYRLSIPNMEVHLVYTDTFRDWMNTACTRHGGDLRRLIAALSAATPRGSRTSSRPWRGPCSRITTPAAPGPRIYITASCSAFWPCSSPSTRCAPTANRATGRPDVLIIPRQPGKPGVVLELKVARPGRKTLDQALDEGMRQLERPRLSRPSCAPRAPRPCTRWWSRSTARTCACAARREPRAGPGVSASTYPRQGPSAGESGAARPHRALPAGSSRQPRTSPATTRGLLTRSCMSSGTLGQVPRELSARLRNPSMGSQRHAGSAPGPLDRFPETCRLGSGTLR